jgi:hypothetical protein
LPPLSQLAFVLFCLLAITLYGYGIDADFVFGHDGWCAGRRAIAGTNLVRYGFVATRFAHVRNIDVADPKNFIIYWHHPHGMQLLVGASYSLFGRGEWQTRLVPFLSMMASLAMWWGITWRLFSSTLARATSMLLFLTTPMLVVYGVFVNMDPLVLCASVAACWTYLRFDELPSRKRGLACFLVALVASYSGWDWFVFAALLCTVEVGSWVAHGKLRFAWIATHSAGTLLGFVAVVSHLIMLEGSKDPRQAFRNLFMSRSGGGGRVTFWDVFKAQGDSMLELFTPGLVAVGAIGLLVVLISLLRVRFERRQGIALAFLGTGIAFVAALSQGASVHDFWSSIAAPYFPLIAADLVARAESMIRGDRALRAGRALWALAMGLQVASSLGVIVQRREFPDLGHPAAGFDHHHRDIVVWKWIHDHAPSGPHFLIDRRAAEGGTGAQRTFYADRVERQADFARTPLHNDGVAAFALLDMRRFPLEALAKTLSAWVAAYRLTVIDSFVLAHLKEPAASPNVTYYRSEPELTLPGVGWLRSWHRAAQRLTRDDLLKAEFFLYAGLPEQAKQSYATRKMSEASRRQIVQLHHQVAEHNLKLLSGRKTAGLNGWLSELLPSCQPVKAPIRAVRTEKVNAQMLRATAVIDARSGATPVPQQGLQVDAPGLPAASSQRQHLAVPMNSSVLPEGGLVLFDAASVLRRGQSYDHPTVTISARPGRSSRAVPKYAVPCDRSSWSLPRWFFNPLGR